MTLGSILDPSFTSLYKSVDDCLIHTDVYLPQGNEAEARPVVMIVHGGSFMIGHSRMNSLAQIEDCLDRGWIVLCPDHRLCPQVDVLDGPMTDIRDLLRWMVNGGLDGELAAHGSKFTVHKDKVVALGTSSGGTCVEGLAFAKNIPPVAAIISCYGAKVFGGDTWGNRMDSTEACPPELIDLVMNTFPVATKCQGPAEWSASPAKISDTPAQQARRNLVKRMKADGAANAQILQMVFPPKEKIPLYDPYMNVNEKTKATWPPTWLMHGVQDKGVSVEVSRKMYAKLQEAGIRSKLIELPEHGHAFINMMKKGDGVYQLQHQVLDEVEELLQSC